MEKLMHRTLPLHLRIWFQKTRMHWISMAWLRNLKMQICPTPLHHGWVTEKTSPFLRSKLSRFLIPKNWQLLHRHWKLSLLKQKKCLPRPFQTWLTNSAAMENYWICNLWTPPASSIGSRNYFNLISSSAIPHFVRHILLGQTVLSMMNTPRSFAVGSQPHVFSICWFSISPSPPELTPTHHTSHTISLYWFLSARMESVRAPSNHDSKSVCDSQSHFWWLAWWYRSRAIYRNRVAYTN